MNVELKDLSHNPVYAQVREQIETQIRNKTLSTRRCGNKSRPRFATRPCLPANHFHLPPPLHKNSPSTKAKSNAPTSRSNSSGSSQSKREKTSSENLASTTACDRELAADKRG